MTVWVFRARLFHSFCERGDFWYTDIAKFAGHLPHRYGNSLAMGSPGRGDIPAFTPAEAGTIYFHKVVWQHMQGVVGSSIITLPQILLENLLVKEF